MDCKPAFFCRIPSGMFSQVMVTFVSLELAKVAALFSFRLQRLNRQMRRGWTTCSSGTNSRKGPMTISIPSASCHGSPDRRCDASAPSRDFHPGAVRIGRRVTSLLRVAVTSPLPPLQFGLSSMMLSMAASDGRCLKTLLQFSWATLRRN